MTLQLTPDMLAAAYDFLRTTPPFKGWRLPESDELGFHVVRDPKIAADFKVADNGLMTIRLNASEHGHTTTLLMTVGHEMIHVFQHLKKLDGRVEHNTDFKMRAKRVCAIHGWDDAVF